MKKYPVVPVRDTPSVKLLPIDWGELPWYKEFWDWATLRRKWRVMEDFVVYSPLHGCNLLVPKEFIMDFASVPKALSNIMSPTGVLAEGSVVHDFGYRYGGFLQVQGDGSVVFRKEQGQKDVDKTMVSVGTLCTGAKRPYRLAYRVLRVFGRFNYHPKEFDPLVYEL